MVDLNYLYSILFEVQFLGKMFSYGDSGKLLFYKAFLQASKLFFSESCSATPITHSVTLETNEPYQARNSILSYSNIQ